MDIDSNNNIWMATNDGVIKFDGNNWTFYNQNNSPIPNNVCYTIATEGNIIWIGSVWGLVQFDGGTNWQVYTTMNSGLPYDYIVSINIDSHGVKWIGTLEPLGTDGGGVTKFDGINWTTYDTSNSNISSNWAFNTFVDRTDVKWISTNFGLDIYEDTTFINYTPFNSGLPDLSVGRIKEDLSDSIYWIGTNNGLAKFDRAQNLWSVYDTSNSLPSNYVYDIEIDSLNRKWVSCYYSGIAMYDNSSWIIFDTINVGGFLKYATNLSFDSRGGFWVTTGSGLVYYGDTLLLSTDLEILSKEKKYYTDIFPLPANEFFNVRFHNSATDGEIFIFDNNGKNVYRKHFDYIRNGMTEQINISFLNSGIYFMSIKLDHNYVINKIIISH